VLALDDIPRLAHLHVIASMQPTHATSDMPWAEQRIGPQRIVGAYAWRVAGATAGARLALGSDFPIESVDPRLGLYAAATRTDGEGKASRRLAARGKTDGVRGRCAGFTLDAAYAGFAETEVGSLEVGKRADFVIVAEDPLAIEPAQLRTLTCRRLTSTAGRFIARTRNSRSRAPPELRGQRGRSRSVRVAPHCSFQGYEPSVQLILANNLSVN
jgi:predicted amidohydrolase YtcJ